MPTCEELDRRFAALAFEQAKKSYAEGGLPIGAVLARGEKVLACGHNQRVQLGDPIAHGEMDALRKAGRQRSYRATTLYTTLSPCMMCAGAIVQFKIPRVVVNDTKNFGGNEQFLRDNGVEVIDLPHPESIALMARFIADNPALWNEDIME
ncbi:nucleoside deaminase [Amphiplicatus metriothermophilus]|uniref:Cytosine deaminase n=1 Tax=Amphiplicatus metriothermophilus TaxID=1519374 RepID=A0A239PZP4_9PROT|nr:nucleoside deaminase [Amphiplicatus metriothermophilus]MBB5518216.1 cytosine deaminase [Amphiplicatus metriothermophilus]SNT75402.1 cytosine deaminase [Amphiplicatus metriothermophilus]